MKNSLKQKLMIVTGWLFVILGIIGAILPIMPTTVFLIIALALFSKSSTRFHQMLLDNRLFGKDLQRWERHKSISRKAKIKASVAIVLTFSISIVVLDGRLILQCMLLTLAVILLAFIWSFKE